MGIGGRLARLLAVVGALTVVAPAAAHALPAGQITEFSSGLGPSSRLEGGIAPGADGNLWFGDGGPPAIGRITTTGQITEFSNGLNAKALPEEGISPGADGNAWFADIGCVSGGTCAIGKITPEGKITESPAPIPVGVALGPDGNLWVTISALSGHPAIERITPSGQVTSFSAGLNPGDQPYGITAGRDGNLWFTEQGGTPAIGRITPQGQITLFTVGLNPNSIPLDIAGGQEGNVWFTDQGKIPAVGRITPQGQITEFPTLLPNSQPTGIAAGPDASSWFTDPGARVIGRITFAGVMTFYSSGLNPSTSPQGIAPGADGSMWFTDDGTTPAVGRIGTGVAAAEQGPPPVSGPARQGQTETCGGPNWTLFGGDSPLLSAYGFDGFRWLRDGTAIPGAVYNAYTPTAADVGHTLTCQVTGTYPIPYLVTAIATSAPVKIGPKPALTGLRVRPRPVAGRLVSGRCRALTKANRHGRPCVRATQLRISFTANVAIPVRLALARLEPGRRVGGRCVAPTRRNRTHKACTRALGFAARNVGAHSGLNAVTWTLAPLARGSYRLTATPGGGAARTATFPVVS